MVHVSVLVRVHLERDASASIPSAVSAHVSGLVHVLRAAWLACGCPMCVCTSAQRGKCDVKHLQ